MATHRAVHVNAAGNPLELVEVETTSPPPDHVRIDVNACGVCGTDHAFVAGAFPNLTWPLTPGHEIAGTVAELGSGVRGVRRGRPGGRRLVRRQLQPLPAMSQGPVHAVREPAGAELELSGRVRRIGDGACQRDRPDSRCAVVRRGRADGLRRGDDVQRVATHPRNRRRPGRGAGPGRAGPPGSAMGTGNGLRDHRDRPRRGQAEDAKELGAHHYIDSTAVDVAEALQGLGGAQVVLATAANSAAMAATVGGLAPQGELVIIGATFDPLPIAPGDLLFGNFTVIGHPSGTSADIEDTMHFAVQSGVRARIEEMALAHGRRGLRGDGPGQRAFPHGPDDVATRCRRRCPRPGRPCPVRHRGR